MVTDSNRSNLIGIFSLILGIFVFSIQDAIIKSISGGHAVTLAIFLRAVVAFPVLLAMVHFECGFKGLITKQWHILVLRGCILLCAYTTYFMAFPALPLAEAIALFFMVPLLVTIMSGPMLGEKVTALAWGAVAIGLVGVFIILQPGSALFNPAALLSLISAAPPPQVHENLRDGHLDGYCVGEPWNSLAVLSRTGWCAATSLELAPKHPEKALMVRRDFAEHSEREHLALIAALIESCAFCEKPQNRERLIEMLAQSNYVGGPIAALRMGMGGSFDYGHGRVEKVPRFHIFSSENANEPDAKKAAWVIDNLIASGVVADPALIPREQAADWFRADIFQKARQLTNT